MPRMSCLVHAVAAVAALASGPLAPAQDESYKPQVVKATEEPSQAMKAFRVPRGMTVSPFAAEPMVANPVAFSIDEKGRFYVVETFRLHDGVTDTRNHMNWLDADLATRTVADRVAMYKKYLSAKEFQRYGVDHDRIRLIEDRDGDGKADHDSVFATGFNDPADGLAAGVLARKGDVYFTCIPDLWLLRDRDGDGKADEKKSLATGFGVHVQFLGHDLHGLKFGPDGRLYFSIGDRGLNVTTADGDRLENLDSGSILRCEPDGSKMEIIATGLRNPQELAFTETGDLFTVDNNSDGGDRARLVWVVEGGDSGWRIGYQYIESPNSRGIWNSEKMWHPAWDGQAAYILPPIANLSDGPSGLVYNPGTGLGKEQRNRFFLADFRGSSGSSGVRSFGVRPKGPAFELIDSKEFFWGLEATDCDFGLDGSLYVSDWVEGWNKTGKGRIWKLTDPASATDPIVAQVKTLFAEGFDGKATSDLAKLLSHPDMRVRQESQFALASRAIAAHRAYEKKAGPKEEMTFRDAFEAFRSTAVEGKSQVARLHAIWGIGQVVRRLPGARKQWMEALRSLLKDQDAEIRAQAAKAFSEERILTESELASLLKDPSPRVRFFALMGIHGGQSLDLINGNHGGDVVGMVAELLRTSDGNDPYFRHAAVRALAGQRSKEAFFAIRGLIGDDSPAVRMAVCLVLGRWTRGADVGRFLDDPDPAIVLEAARCIAETNGAEAFRDLVPRLASLSGRSNLSEPLWRRVLWACEGNGGPGDPKALTSIASRNDVPESIRVEALHLLASWAKPSPRHPISGLARALPERPGAPAVAALASSLDGLLRTAPEKVRKAAAEAAGKLGLTGAGPALRAVVADASQPSDARVEALRALAALRDEKLGDVSKLAAKSESVPVRVEAVRALAGIDRDAAIDAIHGILDHGPIAEKQGAFATLGTIPGEKADKLLARWVERLNAGEVPPEARLDLIEAAMKRSDEAIRAGLAKYDAKKAADDPLAPYRDALVGGDPAKGGRVFREKAEVQCLRCHTIDGQGGQVGPDLTGIGGKKDRAYLLESIVLPDKQIAQGFETLIVATKDGQTLAGIVKSQDDHSIRLMTPEGKLRTIPRTEIDETRRGASAMPPETIKNLSPRELRDVIEFLANSKTDPAAADPAGQ